ncbi:Protocatechuate 3,4-dioxygenase beta chain [Planctopirus ephydatiae]|uniref:Protocatechuate 3,4-dioxygenase beta chain n=1 Tax=Planctopirus ephydatiae TaxID=2528019 RepID=A0A518GM52_9PLAN|nr:protocatechuate 3,4-dioxygenase [Planctopirus ephydatiae]QDV29700.1 Protocatechuate 3,4-dioxygenase beta chain [Planctopirus ephydatiae]
MSYLVSRRSFLRAAGFAAAINVSGVFAEELMRTPALTEGPFYPDHLPLDTDNDLLVVNNQITPAVGEITHLSGKLLSSTGEPIRNAFIEIWQVDGNGAYLHTADSRHASFDKNFQGYGRFLTASDGSYYFRTVKPVPYPGRTPHIHFGVSLGGKRVLTTQLLIKGHPQNERDGVFRGVKSEAERNLLLADFQKIPNSPIGELAAKFDMVLGRTPEDDHQVHGIAKSEMASGGGRGPGGPRGGRPPGGAGGPGGRPPRPNVPPSGSTEE